MLDAGKIDTVSNLIAMTEERRAKYDFSTPYACFHLC
ncbi:transporter substrate-binding domain-containing protein [Sutcliffiella sp. NPDC057660]